VEIGEFGQG
jgi:hypothetical protein